MRALNLGAGVAELNHRKGCQSVSSHCPSISSTANHTDFPDAQSSDEDHCQNGCVHCNEMAYVTGKLECRIREEMSTAMEMPCASVPSSLIRSCCHPRYTLHYFHNHQTTVKVPDINQWLKETLEL